MDPKFRRSLGAATTAIRHHPQHKAKRSASHCGDGRPNGKLIAQVLRLLPPRAATAYRSERSTVGTWARSTSRTTPPPMPVSVPQQRRHDGVEPICEGFVCACNGEQCEARCIEDAHRSQCVDRCMPAKHEQAGDQRRHEITPIADRSRRRGSNEHISQNAAGTRCRKSQDEYAEDIQLPPGARRGARQREHKCAGEIENQYQRAHRSGSRLHPVEIRHDARLQQTPRVGFHRQNAVGRACVDDVN